MIGSCPNGWDFGLGIYTAGCRVVDQGSQLATNTARTERMAIHSSGGKSFALFSSDQQVYFYITG